ncbi:hypothetical protein H5410_005309 [Solanum commersonii]|uniref:Isopentenyltransferase n=1 Tax=Solanum commersonii TaxID=4109 RepID=A0A9J6A729_SOLCO|nr:hypothetical protein H5410_005309 [Solanum commersonii]
MWSVHHIIATDVFKERKEVVDKAWRNTLLQPYLDIMKRFLKNDNHNIIIESQTPSPSPTKMNTFINTNNKFNNKKVVFIMGATGTGKYRLSVDLATHFRGEIMTSEKCKYIRDLKS